MVFINVRLLFIWIHFDKRLVPFLVTNLFHFRFPKGCCFAHIFSQVFFFLHWTIQVHFFVQWGLFKQWAYFSKNNILKSFTLTVEFSCQFFFLFTSIFSITPVLILFIFCLELLFPFSKCWFQLLQFAFCKSQFTFFLSSRSVNIHEQIIEQ